MIVGDLRKRTTTAISFAQAETPRMAQSFTYYIFRFINGSIVESS